MRQNPVIWLAITSASRRRAVCVLAGLAYAAVLVSLAPTARADTAEQVITQWSERELLPWPEQAKVRGPRVALAKLIRGRDLGAVQRYFQAAKPWAGMGSDWAGHKGDYDFTTITLVAILHRFGDQPDRLHPDTVRHMLTVLLPCTGGPGDTMVPNTFGMVRDTENHILMIEFTRYLTNQWRFTHADAGNPLYDNHANGLHAWLINHLQQLLRDGFYEFNSVPYEAYTLQALMTIEAFADAEDLRDLARQLLDRIVWHAALGSDGPRRAGPFRRQMRHLNDPGLKLHSANAMAAVWAGWPDEKRRTSDRLIAAALPYRPPAGVLAWFEAKPHDYFVRLGHGTKASPELISGGPGYVLVAGGAARGFQQQVVPRSTVLMVKDSAQAITDCFHLPGAGEPMTWNNTGVHHRFACGPAGVAVPEGFEPVAQNPTWRIYQTVGPRIAVHEQEGLGLLLVLPDDESSAADWLRRLEASNPERHRLRGSCAWPGGERIEYDPQTPAGTWVIQAINGEPTDRDYDGWPLVPGLAVPERALTPPD